MAKDIHTNAGAGGMLILTRRLNETIMIGDDCTVTVLGVKGGQVRLGVHAPKEVPVHREEVYERIKAEAAAGIARTSGSANHGAHPRR